MRNVKFPTENTLIVSKENCYYLTGMDNGDSALFISKDKKIYFTDARYTEDAERKLKSFYIVKTSGKLHDFIISYLGEQTEIGIEDSLPYSVFNNYLEKGFSLVCISEHLRKARTAKDEKELSLIRHAQSITDKVFEKVLPLIKENMTERELASILESLIFASGGDGLAFPSIVAFGENTSKPHAERSDRKLKKSDFITLDFGASYMGYCSDMTRTVCFGNPGSRQKFIYESVKKAQENALENIRAGIRCKDAFNLAYSIFQKENLSEYFVHSLGHGLGLDIHETPMLSPKSDDVLMENSVVSIEPGLYFPGEFGVRIEDIIILHKNGMENLTKSPKNLIII